MFKLPHDINSMLALFCSYKNYRWFSCYATEMWSLCTDGQYGFLVNQECHLAAEMLTLHKYGKRHSKLLYIMFLSELTE